MEYFVNYLSMSTECCHVSVVELKQLYFSDSVKMQRQQEMRGRWWYDDNNQLQICHGHRQHPHHGHQHQNDEQNISDDQVKTKCTTQRKQQQMHCCYQSSFHDVHLLQFMFLLHSSTHHSAFHLFQICLSSSATDKNAQNIPIKCNLREIDLKLPPQIIFENHSPNMGQIYTKALNILLPLVCLTNEGSRFMEMVRLIILFPLFNC